MKKMTLAIWFILLFQAGWGTAEVREIKSLSAIHPLINRQTLVVLDIDNTIAHATQMLGTDQSFDWLKTQFRGKGFDDSAAANQAQEVWKRLQYSTAMQPVEPKAPELIRYWQRQGVAIIALTARSYDLADRTAKQLHDIGIDLRASLPRGTNALNLPLSRGILFATGQDKGLLLQKFLQTRAQKFSRIIFADDKLHNVEDVHKVISQTAMEIYALRYGAADKIVREFSPSIAQVQFYFWQRLLSDRDAKIILHSRRNP